jgi:hypothetical protein
MVLASLGKCSSLRGGGNPLDDVRANDKADDRELDRDGCLAPGSRNPAANWNADRKHTQRKDDFDLAGR